MSAGMASLLTNKADICALMLVPGKVKSKVTTLGFAIRTTPLPVLISKGALK
jgi:hypothetical protein